MYLFGNICCFPITMFNITSISVCIMKIQADEGKSYFAAQNYLNLKKIEKNKMKLNSLKYL